MNANETDIHQRLVRYWTDGALTDLELSLRLCQFITHENVSRVWKDLPQPVRDLLSNKLSDAPRTDSDWAQMFIVESYCGPEQSPQEIQKHESENLQRFRRGVESLRHHLNLS